ncbi:TPA: hypothetical protein ACH3X1_000905 [Trebouxia sp. C0004]
MSVTRGALRDLLHNKENMPAGADGSQVQHAAPKPANSAASRSKRDLFSINEDEASQLDMQEEVPKERLQQFTTEGADREREGLSDSGVGFTF